MLERTGLEEEEGLSEMKKTLAIWRYDGLWSTPWGEGASWDRHYEHARR